MAATQGVQFSQVPQKKSRRADTPFPRGDPAPDEEEEDASTEELIAQADRVVLEEARNTGKLPCVVFKGSRSTRCYLVMGGHPAKRRFEIHGKTGDVSGTDLLRHYGPNGKSQSTSIFVLSEGGGNGKSDDLALNASLGDFMSLHESEMKAIESKWSKAERPLKKPKGPSRTTVAQGTVHSAERGEDRAAAERGDGGKHKRRGGRKRKSREGAVESGGGTREKRVAAVPVVEAPLPHGSLPRRPSGGSATLPALTTGEFLALTEEERRKYMLSQGHLAWIAAMQGQ